MRFLIAIVDAAVGFVQRNPLTCLIILLLGLTAPALLKGIALGVLYLLLGLVLAGVVLLVIFALRIRAARRQMEEQFAQHFGAGGPFEAGAQQERAQQGFGGGQQPGRSPHEGEVHVYQTADAPEKRIARDVGDYVDFAETKNDPSPKP